MPDFSAILAAIQRRRPSVLQIRSGRLSPAAIGDIVLCAIEQSRDNLANGALMVVDLQQTRVAMLRLNP
jgi:predicted nuclease of predicted toxin-antitoxin system